MDWLAQLSKIFSAPPCIGALMNFPSACLSFLSAPPKFCIYEWWKPASWWNHRIRGSQEFVETDSVGSGLGRQNRIGALCRLQLAFWRAGSQFCDQVFQGAFASARSETFLLFQEQLFDHLIGGGGFETRAAWLVRWLSADCRAAF